MNKKHAFHRGFTLIELMIVIVILGILMGTILPRLTGAQGRARDTARTADLNNISQALEVYLNDNGEYPDEDTGNCLDPTAISGTAFELGQYMKGGKVPAPRSETLVSAGCTDGKYYYRPLSKSGVPNSAYVLVTDVETYQMANYTLPSSGFNTVTYSTLTGAIGQPSTEATTATDTVYIVIP